jgi:hypothetical protein
MILRSQWIRLGTLTLMLVCPALVAQSRVRLMYPPARWIACTAKRVGSPLLQVSNLRSRRTLDRPIRKCGFCREAAGLSSF